MFFIRKDRVNAAGQAPIHTRLTIDGDFCQFSTKASVTAKIWDVKSYRAKGHSEEADRINLYLDHFKKTLLNHYQSLFQSNETVTPAMVRDKYMGKETKENTLLSMFREVVFGVGFALLLPVFFGLDGVLYSMPVSDILTFLISAVIIVKTYRELNAEPPKTPESQASA